MSKDDSFEIGYGKPPKSHQFTKGESGNWQGRPKGAKGLASIVAKECRQLVQIRTARGPRRVTKLEAVVMQLANKAAQGEIRATREFMFLVARSEDTLNNEALSKALSASDQSMMRSVHRRLKRLSEDRELVIDEPSAKEGQ